MSRKKKLILIGSAIALAVGLGGVAYANGIVHQNVGGSKLLGIGEMGYYEITDFMAEWWDTNFIITNPNCDRYLTIEWVSLVAGEDSDEWYAEQVIAEGTPDDWYDYANLDVPETLSPHEVWQVSIAGLLSDIEGNYDPDYFMDYYDLTKYTLEITWSDESWQGWWAWRWASGRPLIGWQKEKCWSWPAGLTPTAMDACIPGFSISEDEMQVFPQYSRFQAGEPYFAVIPANGGG
ncbi:MAG: hypothetical protein JW790_04480 [Dehalococcoidales bacterium]|nr:hypothetical protein [Dehalococcoidales bacterium]